MLPKFIGNTPPKFYTTMVALAITLRGVKPVG